MKTFQKISLVAALVLLASCVDEEPAPNTSDNSDNSDNTQICEEAAQHQEECTGEYLTPPECTEAVQAHAKQMLEMRCDEFTELKEGKSDGAFCDWFGGLCTPRENIFDGKSCVNHAECDSGFCLESRCFDGVGSASFSTMLDTFTGTKEYFGSATELLVDPVYTRQRRRKMIENAQHTLHFSAFIIENDEVGKEMVSLFSAAAKRGVEVRVIVDATTQYVFSKYHLLQTMAKAGVKVLVFNPITEWSDLRGENTEYNKSSGRFLSENDRLHEKILVVDGNEAIMGGRNVGDSYLLAKRWRDTDVYVFGKGVKGISQLFLEDWDRIAVFERKVKCENQRIWGFACPKIPIANNPKYSPDIEPFGKAKTRTIFSDPYTQRTSHAYFTTLALVRGARFSITIANSYFVPPRRLRRYLKEAVKRGVKVRVLTNSKASTDAWWMYYASINYYYELIGAGIEIYQYKGTETMHSKLMLVDNEVAVIGSFNLDPRSADDNSESIILIQNGNAVGELGAALEEDFLYSTVAQKRLPAAELRKARAMRLVEPLL